LSPQLYLILVLVVLAAIVGDAVVRGYFSRKHLRALAHQWQMHFAPGDRLRLAVRAAGILPIPGAASIRVRDLIFGTEDGRHRYLFTVDYTVGVIRGKVGRSCVAGFQEPVSRGGRSSHAAPVLIVAPRNLAFPAAYQHILKNLGPEIPSPKSE
jgi:hypothetical protein